MWLILLTWFKYFYLLCMCVCGCTHTHTHTGVKTLTISEKNNDLQGKNYSWASVCNKAVPSIVVVLATGQDTLCSQCIIRKKETKVCSSMRNSHANRDHHVHIPVYRKLCVTKQYYLRLAVQRPGCCTSQKWQVQKTVKDTAEIIMQFLYFSCYLAVTPSRSWSRPAGSFCQSISKA